MQVLDQPRHATGVGFTSSDWARIHQDYLAWWEGRLPRALVPLSGPRPGAKPTLPYQHFTSNYPADWTASQVVDAIEDHLATRAWYGDGFPCFWVNFGPGVAAAFTDLVSLEPAPHTVWFKAKQRLDVAQVRIPAPTDSFWYRRVADITAEAARRFGDLVQVAHTDLGGNLDIVASFVDTETLAVELVERPEEVERLLWEAHRAWWVYYDALLALIQPRSPGTCAWAPTWSPKRTYMLQCDFAYMISPKAFGRFVLPELAATCKRLDHAFYHLDGVGQLAHLDQLLALPELHGIQWIPGDGKPRPHTWDDVLGRIRKAGKLCQIYTDREGARHVLRTHGGKGFLLAVYDNLSPAEAEAFLREIEQY